MRPAHLQAPRAHPAADRPLPQLRSGTLPRAAMLLLGATLAVGACAHPRPSAPAPPAGSGRGAERPQLPPPPAAVPLEERDLVAPVLRLPPLADGSRASGREVRVWIGGALGYPRQLYRVVEDEAAVRGALYFYWRLDRDRSLADSMRSEALIRRRMRGTCGEILTGSEYEGCAAAFVGAPDWAAALREAEAAGLWTLPDEGTLPERRMVIDGWSLEVETHAGGVLRRVRYANPSTGAGPESAAALRIARAFAGTSALVAPSEVVHRYRGLLRVGPSLREFVPCGTGLRWKIDGNLADVAAGWSSAPRADSLVTGIQQRYVEVTGELTPEWLARQWEAGYPRVLQVERVEKVTPWTAETCAGAPPPRIPR